MSTTCSKTFSLTINPAGATLNAYWTFDNIIGNEAYDEVNNFKISWYTSLTGSFYYGAGGKIGVGAGTDGVYSSKPVVLPGEPGFGFDNTGAGASIWFWFRYVNGSLTNKNILLTANPFYVNIKKVCVGFVPTTFDLDITLGGTTVTKTIPFADLTWIFVAATYNTATQDIIVYVDNLATATGVASATPVSVNNVIPVWSPFLGIPTTVDQCLFDELGFAYDGVITPAQVASLYNAGSGVTWPAVNAIVPL